MNDLVIMIQARSGSTRLPGKVLKELEPGWTLLDQVVSQCRLTGFLCVVVCPVGDSLVTEHCRTHRYPYFEGSETDVLDRYYSAATAYNAKWVMRITSDCPFVPVAQMHYLGHLSTSNDLDWATNLPTVDGWDIDVVSNRLLTYMQDCIPLDDPEREHVTSFLHHNRSKISTLGYRCTFYQEAMGPGWIPKLSIDTQNDFDRMQALWSAL